MVAATQFESIAKLKNKTLATLATWTGPQLAYKPLPTEWCVLEIVDHLARTDAGITAQMRANAAKPLPLTLANRAAGKAFNVMFRSPIKVKTPAAASAILPICPPNLPTAAAAWNAAIDQLREFLSSLDKEPSGALFAHPVAGPMSLATALGFLETHTHHHLHQLDRLRKSFQAA